MKLSHLSILFVIIMIIVIISSDITSNNLKAMAKAKSRMDFNINQAIDNGALQLIQYESSGEEVVNKEKAVESFLSSLYASLGILSNPFAREQLLAYVPVIIVTADDGYYIMYQDMYKGSDGSSYVTKRWTEKIPYVYEDESFIYRLTITNDLVIYDKHNLIDRTGEDKLYKANIISIKTNSIYKKISKLAGSDCLLLLDEKDFIEARQQAIISQIENDLSWYVSRHNDIAKRFAIEYAFGLPVINASDWQKALEGTGIMVFFQGLPLIEGSRRVYNRFAYSGGGIRKKSAYYIEQRGWYYVYHKETCTELEENSYIRDEQYGSVEDCAKLGAYACEICCPAGVHEPGYKP